MQDKFQEKLNNLKNEKTTTIVKPFEFKASMSKPLERTYVNEGNAQAASIMKAATGGDKLKEKLAAKTTSVKAKSSVGGPPVKQPSSTRKDVLLQERRRQELEAKKAQEEAKAKEDAERKARQNQVSKAMVKLFVHYHLRRDW